jgi:hypothetical protein
MTLTNEPFLELKYANRCNMDIPKQTKTLSSGRGKSF